MGLDKVTTNGVVVNKEDAMLGRADSFALNDVDLVLLHTAVLSPDGQVFTMPDTPGASRAQVLRSRQILVHVGRPEWSREPGECEWLITERGRRAFEEHERTNEPLNLARLLSRARGVDVPASAGGEERAR